MTVEKCSTCKNAFTTGKDRFYCKKSLADKGDCTEYIAKMSSVKQEPCDDAISRQAVNILVDELARAISDERCCISRGRSTATIMQDILDLPSVKLQDPKEGHWIRGFGNTSCECSKCGGNGNSQYKYCPWCGARMESEEKDGNNNL